MLPTMGCIPRICSRKKFRACSLALVIVLLLVSLSFFVCLTFFSTHDTLTFRLNVERIRKARAHVNNGSCEPVVGEQAPEYTTLKTEESDPNAGENVTLIIGRRPQRIKLADSLRLDKIHMAIKTSAKFHHSRLELLLLTWLQTVPPSSVS